MRKYAAGAVLIPMLMLGTAAFAASPEHWVEGHSRHFTVLTDSSEKEAWRLASRFERMRMVFHTLLPEAGDDSGPPIVVIAVKDREDMQALEPVSYLEKGQIDVTGFFLRAPDKNYILVRLDAPEEHAYGNVYHEYTHYVLRKDSWLPLWLNEGLAQFYENTDINENTVRMGQANAEALQFLSRNEMLPLTTLLAVDTQSPYYHEEEKGSIFYAESWALTHFLTVSDRIEGTHRIRDYAELLAQGEDSVGAARKAFGDLDKLQQGLSNYLMQRKFMYFMMPATLPAEDTTFAVQPVSEAEADAVRADVMIYTRRTMEAERLLETVLREDPGNAGAHASMGSLCYGVGNFAGAEAWYREAVGLDARSYMAQYYSALAAMRAGVKGEDATIEGELREAIALNPEFAPAYDTLAMFDVLQRHDLEEARTLNARAVKLDPAVLSYRLNGAEILLAERQFASATEMLQAAMRLAKTREEVATVTSRMARVEKYETAQAR